MSVLSRLLQADNKSLRLTCKAPEFAVWVDTTKPLKPRNIQDPRGITERLHYRLCELLDRVVKPDFLHSATRKRSAITNAARHISKAPCVTTDMKSFYEVTTTQQVAAFFREDLHMAPDLALKLAQLCTVNGHLPTGSPLSPLLAYWAHRRTFGQLYEMSWSAGIVMTVYVDDLAFSGEHASLAFLHIVKQILRRRGLHTHKDKSFGAGQFKHITGAAVSSKGLHVPNGRLKRIVDGIDELTVVSDPAQQADLRRRLVGRIASASAISRQIGNALKRRHIQSAESAVTD
ncbi:reverse transcriptase family protein [Cupriavidus campinensis]|nr:reverse transcriptase family protein [Cupriavidus campinensis]